MTQKQKIKDQISSHLQEKILVVRRSALFAQGAWNGLQQVDFEKYTHIITHKKEFHPRATMEQDPTYKQIIPYLVFTYADKYFVMQRKESASEQRLKNKLSLGIGGHIRKEDMKTDSLFDWARREFHEEVHYSGSLEISQLGIINDDTNDVGKVHVGFVFLLKGESSEISIKSELKSGSLFTLDECINQIDDFEPWSQYIISFLQQ